MVESVGRLFFYAILKMKQSKNIFCAFAVSLILLATTCPLTSNVVGFDKGTRSHSELGINQLKNGSSL